MPVQSVERAIALLVACAHGPRSLTDLSTELGLPTSTTGRLLATLHDLDVVRRHDDGRYGPGSIIEGLMLGFDRTAHLRTLALPGLTTLVEHTGESCGISIPVGNEVQCVADLPCANLIQIRDFTDTRLPLHVVATGLVVLAHWSPAMVDSYLAGELAEVTENSVTAPSDIRARLQAARAAGYAWTEGDFALGVSAVAAPVLDANDDPVAAIYCHAPSDRLDEAARDRAQEGVHKLAQQLSAALGHTD